MNTTRGIIIGAAIGLTIAIWVIAYLMLQHFLPSPEATLPTRNVSALPTVSASPEQKQDEAVKQQSNEKQPITEPSQIPQEQPKPLQNLPAKSKKEAYDNGPTYKVKLIIPSDMSDADIFVDGRPAVITDRQLTVVTIRVEQKNQPTTILLRKEEKMCGKPILINRNIEITPCK
jgi:hypothetical protein